MGEWAKGEVEWRMGMWEWGGGGVRDLEDWTNGRVEEWVSMVVEMMGEWESGGEGEWKVRERGRGEKRFGSNRGGE